MHLLEFRIMVVELVVENMHLLYETVCLYKISLKRRNCSLSN